MRLPIQEVALLEALGRVKSPPIELRELAAAAGLHDSVASAIVEKYQEQGWLAVREEIREEILLHDGVAERVLKDRLPEQLVARFLEEETDGQATIPDIQGNFGTLAGFDMGVVFKSDMGHYRKEKPNLLKLVTREEHPQQRAWHEHPWYGFFKGVASGRWRYVEDFAEVDRAEAQQAFNRRRDVCKLKKRTLRLVELTPRGREKLAGGLEGVEEVTALTPELLKDGGWRNVLFRPYDVTLAAERRRPGKRHPLVRVIQEARQAFLELGFKEVRSPLVESSFWNFDALFQPQDHPARELQDTFYLEAPQRLGLPAADKVERVGRTHEDGGDTGSTGWGYRWSAEVARKAVLRTHTTATTVRALAEWPETEGGKYFTIGRVFRRETVSRTHLPEFHQIDGIVVHPEANLSWLFGILTEFYRLMGIPAVKLKPAFFPYTEPSAEVYVRLKEGGKWLEMGGCGIFRPEVAVPLGSPHPVLAWGLGLERLAMKRFGIHDIRDLYLADYDWIREVPLCR